MSEYESFGLVLGMLFPEVKSAKCIYRSQSFNHWCPHCIMKATNLMNEQSCDVYYNYLNMSIFFLKAYSCIITCIVLYLLYIYINDQRAAPGPLWCDFVVNPVTTSYGGGGVGITARDTPPVLML